MDEIKQGSDACIIATGVTDNPNMPNILGIDAKGVYSSMEFLKAQKKGIKPGDKEKDVYDFRQADVFVGEEHVIVWGGGLTANDCKDWSGRHIHQAGREEGSTQGTITQIIRHPEPGEGPTSGAKWPNPTDQYVLTTSDRVFQGVSGNPRYNTTINEILHDDDGHIRAVKVSVTEVPEWAAKLSKAKRAEFGIKAKPVEGMQDVELPCTALVHALGFVPMHKAPNNVAVGFDIVTQSAEGKDVVDIHYGRTNQAGVYAAGDADTMIGAAQDWTLHKAGGNAKSVMELAHLDLQRGIGKKDPDAWKKEYDSYAPATMLNTFSLKKLVAAAKAQFVAATIAERDGSEQNRTP